jgi:hypothetical protein
MIHGPSHVKLFQYFPSRFLV